MAGPNFVTSTGRKSLSAAPVAARRYSAYEFTSFTIFYIFICGRYLYCLQQRHERWAAGRHGMAIQPKAFTQTSRAPQRLS